MAPFFLLATISLALLCNSQADLISTVCSQASNPSLCIQVLKSDPRSRGADLIRLGQIIIKKAEVSTKNTLRVVKTFNKGKNKGAVDVCVETCNSAIDALKECSQLLKKFNKGRKGDLQTYGSGALTNVGTCDDEFGSSEPIKVKKASKKAQDLISVLLVIANSL